MSAKKYNKHSLAEKLEAVRLNNEGNGSTTISNKLSICPTVIQSWLNIYRYRGIDGFKKQSKIRATLELKQEIVKSVLENNLSYESASLKYHVSQSAVFTWVLQVKKYGYSSLNEIKPIGRPPGNMGRPKKKEPETDLEKLQAEVEYLRAENAYLKKLRALVEERIARETGTKSKPSKR